MAFVRSSSRRLPRTVLLTDIVGSTEMAAQVGDRRWRRTVAQHHRLVRRELKRHHGREVDTAGDGFFALFESPTDAVACAAAVIAAVHGIGLRVRAGLHTGEVETSGEKAGGIAVHIAARLLAMAGREEVLVSSTVRDLAAGSVHEFVDRGEHELKGVPGRWHVFALALPRLDATIAQAAEEDERAGASSRRMYLTAAAAAAAAAAALAVVAVGVWLLRPSAPPATGSGTVVAYGPAGSDAIAGWPVGRGPSAIAAADGVMWVANIDGGTVARIDTTSGASTTLGQVGAHPAALLITGNQVWIADPFTDRLSVVSNDSGQLIRQLDMHASALSGGDRVVWAADELRDTLVAIDAQTFAERVRVALPTPAGPTSLAAVEDLLWVAAPRTNGVVRVAPASGMASVVPLDIAGVTYAAAAGPDLWIASQSTDLVARLDGRTGRVAMREEVCDAPVAIAPAANGAWVACATERALWRLDMAGVVVQTIALDGVPTSVTADGERVWVALRGD